MTHKTELIPFHGDALIYIERDGVPFVAIKPICEYLRIDWSAQRKKLASRSELYGVAVFAIPSAGGEQETSCIPVNRLAMWLASVHPSKIAPELRDALTRYQIEAADVLDAHFRLRREEARDEVGMLKAMLSRSHGHLLASMTKWAKIKLLYDADLWWSSVARRVNLSDAAFHEQTSEMQRCGILPLGPWTPGNHATDWFGRMRRLEHENRMLKERVADAQLIAFEAQQAMSAEPEDDDADDGEDENDRSEGDDRGAAPEASE